MRTAFPKAPLQEWHRVLDAAKLQVVKFEWDDVHEKPCGIIWEREGGEIAWCGGTDVLHANAVVIVTGPGLVTGQYHWRTATMLPIPRYSPDSEALAKAFKIDLDTTRRLTTKLAVVQYPGKGMWVLDQAEGQECFAMALFTSLPREIARADRQAGMLLAGRPGTNHTRPPTLSSVLRVAHYAGSDIQIEGVRHNPTNEHRMLWPQPPQTL